MSLDDMKRELRNRYQKLKSRTTWADTVNDMVEFYIKKFERAELLTPLIPPEAVKKLETTHSPKEIKREAINIVDPAIECMKRSSHPRWLKGFGVEKRMEGALRNLRECKLIRPTDRFLEHKQESACTFAVEEMRNMIHDMHSARWALADGCPAPGVSLDEADMRISMILKDLDLARDLEMVKKIVTQNKEWLREKLERMKRG